MLLLRDLVTPKWKETQPRGGWDVMRIWGQGRMHILKGRKFRWRPISLELNLHVLLPSPKPKENQSTKVGKSHTWRSGQPWPDWGGPACIKYKEQHTERIVRGRVGGQSECVCGRGRLFWFSVGFIKSVHVCGKGARGWKCGVAEAAVGWTCAQVCHE